MAIYLKYGSLRGTAKGKYKGWFLLETVRFPSSPISMYGGQSERMVVVKEFHLTRNGDEAAPQVYAELLNDKPASAVLEYTKIDAKSKLETVYQRITFSGALITAYEASANSSVESWTVGYESAQYAAIAAVGGN